MCENAHKALVPMMSLSHQQVPVCFVGTEWSGTESTHEQKYKEQYMERKTKYVKLFKQAKDAI